MSRLLLVLTFPIRFCFFLYFILSEDSKKKLIKQVLHLNTSIQLHLNKKKFISVRRSLFFFKSFGMTNYFKKQFFLSLSHFRCP